MIALILAVFFALVAGGMWFFYVRPVPEIIGLGVITGKTFYAAERIEKSVPRTTRSIEQTPYEIKYDLPDRYAFRVRLENKDVSVVYTAPALGSEKIEIGSKVKLIYEERSMPFAPMRYIVKAMEKVP